MRHGNIVVALVLGWAFMATLACSSHKEADGNDAAPASSAGSSGAPVVASPMAGGGGTTAVGNSDGMGGTPPHQSAGNSAVGGSSGQSSGGGATQCRDDAPAAEWDANCLACASGEACAICLCTNCAQAIRDCEATEGCKQIAACVQSSGCQGVDCYCGTDTLPMCTSGGGNGPCKDIILGAPGGKAPTVADLSGGPASDAVAQVALCMQDQSKCGATCP
jgi:hypothetical protein